MTNINRVPLKWWSTRCHRSSFLLVGESVEELDQLFEEVEERWGYLETLLEEAKRQVRVANNNVKFQQEAAKIQELLTKSHEKQAEDEETVRVVPVSTVGVEPEEGTLDSTACK